MQGQAQAWRRAAVAAGLGLASGAAGAQAAIEEIIVTTQKRAQALQDVPIAVSAFSESFMEQLNVKDARGLVDLTPGFNGRTDDGFIDALAIRGISTNDFGIGGDPSVAIFVDGMYEGRNGGAVTTFLDVERAEVVRGPQNTLFGRNAIAGAISVVTNKPNEEFGGSLSAAFEEYDHYEVEGTVNIPLSDRWFLRGTGYFFTEDGYLDNLAGGDDLGEHESTAFQAALRYAGDRVDGTFSVFYEDRESDPSVYWATAPLDENGALALPGEGSQLPKDQVASDLGASGRGTDDPDVFRAVLNLDIQLSGGYALNSITGFKTYDYFYLEDYDATAELVNNYQQDQEVDYISQEFRLNSPDEGRVVWFVGASVYSEEVDAVFDNVYDEDALCRALQVTEAPDFDLSARVTGCDDPIFEEYWEDDIDPADILTGKSERNINEADYWGWAVFADATLALTDRLDLIVGARYTYDEKEFQTSVPDSGGALGNNFNFEFFTDGFVRDQDDWSGFTPRIALNYEASDRWTFYGNVAWGYKSGGYSTFGLDIPDADGDGEPDIDEDGLAAAGTKPKKFDDETVISAEIGARARLMDNRLQANLSVYTYQYDDLQLTFFTGGSQLTDNVAEASGSGAELDLRWVPTANWDFFVTLAYSDTEIDKVDQDFLDVGGCDNCAGNELWFAPEWSTAEVVTYRIPLSGDAEVYLSAQHHYQDQMFAGPDNLALATTDSWNEFAFRVGYDSGEAWAVVAYVENAFDEEWFERGWENADASNEFGYGLINTLVWPAKPRTFGIRADYRF